MRNLSLTKFYLPHFIIGVFTFVFFVSATEIIINLYKENQLERERASVMDKFVAVRAKIEGKFNSMLFLSASLMAPCGNSPSN
jgi:hypothetical protein